MTNDADALLKFVLAAPDDDAPRLVFADWLDEHGDPDRAAFIRAQVVRISRLAQLVLVLGRLTRVGTIGDDPQRR